MNPKIKEVMEFAILQKIVKVEDIAHLKEIAKIFQNNRKFLAQIELQEIVLKN